MTVLPHPAGQPDEPRQFGRGEDPIHEPFPGTDAQMFIQWKGTDVCLDFSCPCGSGGHLDGMFAYYVRCPSCRTVYELGTQVKAVKRADFDGDGPVQDLI